jgi:hypothetical protein
MKNFMVLMSSVAIGISLSLINQPTAAQTPAPPPSYDKLEQAITHGFFTSGPATAGNDWCFEIESDPNQNVWNFAVNSESSGGKIVYYPHIIDYAARM